MNSLPLRSLIPTPTDIPEFVDLNFKNNVCPVCRSVLKDCMQLPCGHKVCSSCVNHIVDGSSVEGTCPINDEDCFQFSKDSICPDYGTRREVLRLKVYCPYKQKGCSITIEWLKLQNHKETCKYKPTECPNKGNGCLKMLSFNDIEDHVTNFCQFSAVECQFCDSSIMRQNLQDHLSDDCIKYPVPCRYSCNISEMSRDMMKKHEQNCPMKLVKCPFSSFGCDYEGKDGDIQVHEKSAVVEHLSLNHGHANKIGNRNKEIQNEIQAVTKKTNELKEIFRAMENEYGSLVIDVEEVKKDYSEFQVRIVATVEKVCSIEGTLRNVPSKLMTDQFEHEITSLKKDQEEMRRKFSVLETHGFAGGVTSNNRTIELLKKKIANVERQAQIQDIRLAELDLRFQVLETACYDGTMMWKITDYSRRKQDAITGRTFSLFSQPFYTGQFGYKMCGRVYLNGDGMGKGTHLSFFFVVMLGHHDALLPWPFKQQVKMCLLDQQDGTHPVFDNFRPDTTSSSFQKPTNEMNTAVGCPLFVSHTKLETRKYLKDDTIFLKICVDTAGLPHH